jgi:hypothetical protein
MGDLLDDDNGPDVHHAQAGSRAVADTGRPRARTEDPARSGLRPWWLNRKPDAARVDLGTQEEIGKARGAPERGVYIDGYRLPASLEAMVVVDHPVRPLPHSPLGLLTGLLGIGVSAVVATTIMLLAGRFPSSFSSSHSAPTEQGNTAAQSGDQRAAPAASVNSPAVEAKGPTGTDARSDLGPPISPSERRAVASLVARGRDLLINRDFSAARLILQRAAESRDADAALTLGKTYDPIVLERLAIRSQVANVDLARIWYNKASEFGSKEARSRLERLSSYTRSAARHPREGRKE